MSVDKAKDYFLGKSGNGRLNCAQAVLAAFKDKFDLSDEFISSFKDFGAGKAPHGFCGAFYAAKTILENSSAGLLRSCESAYNEKAGSVKCKEIRSLKKISCLDCIELACLFLSE